MQASTYTATHHGHLEHTPPARENWTPRSRTRSHSRYTRHTLERERLRSDPDCLVGYSLESRRASQLLVHLVNPSIPPQNSRSSLSLGQRSSSLSSSLFVLLSSVSSPSSSIYLDPFTRIVLSRSSLTALFPFIFQSQPLSLEFASLFGARRLCFHVSLCPFKHRRSSPRNPSREIITPFALSPLLSFDRGSRSLVTFGVDFQFHSTLVRAFLRSFSKRFSSRMLSRRWREPPSRNRFHESRESCGRVESSDYVCIYRTQMQSETLTKVKTSGRVSLSLSLSLRCKIAVSFSL